MTRRGKVVIAILGVALFVMGFVIGRGFKIAQEGFYRFFAYPHRYIECEPGVLLPYLEEQFGLALPADSESVLTARTWGVLDSTHSGFLVRFITCKENIEDFRKGLGEKTVWRDYDAASDQRESHWQTPPPPWFTTKIDSGKIGERSVSPTGLNIYIYVDQSDKERAIVYCHGIYARPEEDFRRAYESN